MAERSQRTITIYADDRGSRELLSKPKTAGPHVGIWWEQSGTIVAILQLVAEIRSRAKLLDSDLDHWCEWPLVCGYVGLTESTDYFTVPRGRAMVRRRDGHGVILHGNATSPATLKRIAKVFRLDSWTAERDPHYLMGPDADNLFDD